MEDNIKEKKKHKFNFVDAIIIAVALLLVAALAFVFIFDGAAALSGLFGRKEKVRIRYAVEFAKVKEEIVENNISKLEMGDEVIDAVKNYDIGSFVEYFPYHSELIDVNSDGNAVVSEYPGHKSIVVVVEAYAEKDGYGYYINGYDLQVGSKVSISTAEFADTGYCVALKEITDGEESIAAFNYSVGKLYDAREEMIKANKDEESTLAEPAPSEPVADNTDAPGNNGGEGEDN